MRTWGLMLKFIPFGWNAVLTYQYLGVELLPSEKIDKSLQLLSGKYMAEYCLLALSLIIIEGFCARRAYMGNSMLQALHTEGKFWN